MPRLQLTKRNIDKITSPENGQVDYFDTELKGLGLRVGKESKTFFVKIDILKPSTGKYKSVKGKIWRYGAGKKAKVIQLPTAQGA